MKTVPSPSPSSQTREEFLAERRKGMGGSDIAAALGLDYTDTADGRRRYRKTPYQLYLEKTGQDEGRVAGAAARRGNFLEKELLLRYAQTMQPEALTAQIPFDVDGWRRGNMDARATFAEGIKRTVEAKTVSKHVFRREWGTPGTDEVPDRALVQGLWYANLDDSAGVDFAVLVIPDDPDEVLGLDAAQVAALSQFHVFQAARDRETEQSTVDLARAFWFDHVVARVAPDPSNADDVEQRWSACVRDKGKPVDVQLASMIEQYVQLSHEASATDKQRSVLRERLLLAAGDAEFLLGPGGSPWLQLKHEPRKEYVVKASNPRVLRVTKWWKQAHPQFAAAKEE